MLWRNVLLRLAFAFALAAPAAADPAMVSVLGDTSACLSGTGPAIRANITGLKDRAGELKLELYPANDEDFLRDDRDLIREGKVFRRIRVAAPHAGRVALCMKVPDTGHYALLFTHNRDGRNKFDFWSDGAGFPGNVWLGRSRPKLEMAAIDVGAGGVTVIDIRAQYLRGFAGFGPLDGED